jgi:lysophospholipase L1-like esterase
MSIPAGSRYVGMGSSFAAGPGLPSRVPGSPRRAGRSTGNYAHIVARALGLDLHDVTFSGATTSDILGLSAAGRAAQLDAVTPETSLVTITGGGNDVGYLPRLTLASVPWPLRVLPQVTARVDALGEPSATDERFEQLGRSLAAIAGRLRDRAPPAASSSSTICRSCPPTAPTPNRRRQPKSQRGDERSRPGWRPPRRRPPVTPAGPTSPPRLPPPITMPGPRSRGRGAFTCPYAEERRTTRTRPGWRRSPSSSSPRWPRTAE